MPILRIEIVSDTPQRGDLARRLADAAAVALASRPQATWVKLEYVPTSYYAENGGAVAGPPIIVSLLQADVPDGRHLRDQVRRLAKAVAETVGHP